MRRILIVIKPNRNWSCRRYFGRSEEAIFIIPNSSGPDLTTMSLARTVSPKTGKGGAMRFYKYGDCE